MATTNYSITVDTSQALRAVDGLSSKFSSLQTVTSRLNTVLATAVSAATFKAYTDFSDAVANINNRLITVSKNADDAAKQFAALSAIAVNTRSSFDGVATVYNKMIMASKTLGISQKDAAEYTKTLAQALKLSGASTAEANSTMLQFSQGLSSGVFQGDELRSILEGNIVIVQALAKEMGVSTTQIKKMGSEGKITADVMLKALKNSADEIDASFAKMTPTIGQAFEVLRTGSMVAFNEFEKNTKTGQSLAYSIEYLAMVIQKAAASVDQWIGVAKGIAEVISVLLGITLVGKAFEVASIAAVGFFRIVTAGGAGLAKFASSVKDISVALKNIVTGKLPEGMGAGSILGGLDKGLEIAQTRIGAFGKSLGAVIGGVGAYLGFDTLSEKFGEMSDSSSQSRQELDNFQKKNEETTLSVLDSAKSQGEAFSALGNKVTEQVSRETAALNKLIAAYKESTIEAAAKFQQDTANLGMTEEQRLSMDQYTQSLDAYRQKITELKADIEAKRATGSEADLAMIPKLEQAIKDVTSAYYEQAAGINTLVEARLKAEASAAMETFKTKERIDLENKLIAIEDERAKSTMSEIEKKYYDIDAAARAAAKAQIEAREAQLGPGVRLGSDERNAILEQALKGTEELKSRQRDSYLASRTFEAGWTKAFKAYRDNAENAAMQAEKIFQGVTQGMEDMIVNFTKTGKFEWKSFIESITEMLLRSQLQQLMASIFGINTGNNNNQGSSLLGGLGSLMGFANGGIIPTNQPVLVGERGPELLMNAAGNRVIPNAGGTSNVTYNISAVDALSFKQMIAKDPSFLYAVTQQGSKSVPRRV